MSTHKHVAVICASNMNRSMATHVLFVHKGVPNVSSYGTNTYVKLPGPSIDKPNVYDFGTPYEEIYSDLENKDADFYRHKGLLSIVKRNANIKRSPERFQDEDSLQFDIIFTFEARVFDIVVDFLRNRTSTTSKPVHVINVTVKDTPEDAPIGAENVYKLFKMIEQSGEEWEDQIDEIIDEYQSEHSLHVLHSVLFY